MSSRHDSVGIPCFQAGEDVKVLIDRSNYWQCAFIFPKGSAETLRSEGIVAMRARVAASLASSLSVDALLAQAEKRRLWPTKVVQAGQRIAQDRLIGAAFKHGANFDRPPWLLRMLNRFPLLRRIPGRMVGLGIRRERVNSLSGRQAAPAAAGPFPARATPRDLSLGIASWREYQLALF